MFNFKDLQINKVIEEDDHLEELDLKELNDSQKAFMQWLPTKDKKSILLHGGTRSGKTLIACMRAVLDAGEREGLTVIIMASTLGQVELTLGHTIKTLLRHFEIPYINTQIAYHKAIVLPETNSRFIYAGFQGNSIEEFVMGAAVDIILVDESGKLSSTKFTQLYTRLSGTRKDVKEYAYVVFLTNAVDDVPHIYTYYIEEKKGTSIEFSTYANIDNLQDGYVDSLKNELPPELFARYVENKWGVLKGRLWPEIPKESILDVDMNGRDYDYYVAGLDFGYRHPAAFTIAGMKASHIFVINSIALPGLDIDELAELIVDTLTSAGISEIRIYTDHDPVLVKSLHRRLIYLVPHMRISMTNAIKTELGTVAIGIYGFLQKHKIHFCKNATKGLIREMECAVWDPRVDGKILKKEGHPDDHVDTLIYLCSDFRIRKLFKRA